MYLFYFTLVYLFFLNIKQIPPLKQRNIKSSYKECQGPSSLTYLLEYSKSITIRKLDTLYSFRHVYDVFNQAGTFFGTSTLLAPCVFFDKSAKIPSFFFARRNGSLVHQWDFRNFQRFKRLILYESAKAVQQFPPIYRTP